MISGSGIATFCGLACAVPALVVGLVGPAGGDRVVTLRLLDPIGERVDAAAAAYASAPEHPGA